MKNERVVTQLRLDAKIHEALKIIAVHEMRSLNTQIEYFLRECVNNYETTNKNVENAVRDAIDDR